MLAIEQRQFLDLPHQLGLSLQLPLPLVHIELPDELQQVGVEIVITLIPPRRIKRKNILLVLHELTTQKQII